MWDTCNRPTLIITFDISIAEIKKSMDCWALRMQEGGLYVEDQASVHGAGGSWWEQRRHCGFRPSCSPDFNPIENVWRILKQCIEARSRFSTTVAEMRVAVQGEWDRLQPSDFNKYIDQMPQRIAQLKERKGMQTEVEALCIISRLSTFTCFSSKRPVGCGCGAIATGIAGRG